MLDDRLGHAVAGAEQLEHLDEALDQAQQLFAALLGFHVGIRGEQRLFELPIELAERQTVIQHRTTHFRQEVGLRLPALHRFLGAAQKVDGLDAGNRLTEAVAIEDLGRGATQERVRPDQLVDGRGLQVQLLAVVLLEGDEAPLGVALALLAA